MSAVRARSKLEPTAGEATDAHGPIPGLAGPGGPGNRGLAEVRAASGGGISTWRSPPAPASGRGSVHRRRPDAHTLVPTPNSKVLVADVYVGRVRAITMENWVATLTLDVQKGVRLPRNATAKIGQTSLLGTQHVETPQRRRTTLSDVAARERRHHRPMERLRVPDDRADPGQSRH